MPFPHLTTHHTSFILECGFSNWELTPYPGITINRPVMRVYRKLNAPLAEWILRKKKSPLPGEVVPKGNKGAIKMLSILRSKGIVLLLSDQRLNTGIKIDFMGYPANTLTSPAVMSLKLNFVLLVSATFTLLCRSIKYVILTIYLCII